MNFFKKYYPLLLLVVLLAWTVSIYYISPSQIVEKLGIENGYLVAFLVAFFGGLSSFINFPYQIIIFTLGAGGLNPFIIGLTAGTGVFLGDSVSYLIGFHGRNILPPKFQKIFQKLCKWCLSGPSWVVYVALFLYGAFVPLPNDLIIISMALGHYPYLKLIIPLGLGNITFNTLVALLGWYSFYS